MISKFKRALIIAPHFDDVELGCGGAIQRLVWHDCDIHCVIVAKDDVRKKEFEKAAEILGITSFEYLDFPDTFLDTKRQEILNKFRDIKNRICPDIVFCPSEKDLHQDHATVGKEAMREFRDTTLLAY
ncbi:MAG: PIG-L family deacetylase, partial [bacterium]|nr:PIG-L family deacetylase [bacterium]